MIILPRALIADVLQQAHGTLLTGHGSVDKTLARIRTQYYWPYMRAVVQQTILECELCQKAIQKGHGGSKLHPLPLCTGTNQRVPQAITELPFVIGCIDEGTKQIHLSTVLLSQKLAGHFQSVPTGGADEWYPW